MEAGAAAWGPECAEGVLTAGLERGLAEWHETRHDGIAGK